MLAQSDDLPKLPFHSLPNLAHFLVVELLLCSEHSTKWAEQVILCAICRVPIDDKMVIGMYTMTSQIGSQTAHTQHVAVMPSARVWPGKMFNETIRRHYRLKLNGMLSL